MSSAKMSSPKRGEIWLINFDPTKGSEIEKTRPAIVVSSDYIGRLPIKVVVPITGWRSEFAHDYWHIKIEPNSRNNLNKISAIDTLQVRGLDIMRFMKKIGHVTIDELNEITGAIGAVIEYK